MRKEVKFGDRILTQEEKEDIYISISCRLGFIETGTIHRAKDLVNVDKNFKPKILTTDQMKRIISLEKLMMELL